MDILSLTPVERIIEIQHPVTGAELGVRVTLMSIEDDRLKKLKRQILDDRIRLEQRGKTFKSEDIEENSYALAMGAIIGWEWYGEATLEGKKPDFNPKNVRQVLEKLSWFRKQIEEAVSDDKAFFQT